MTTDPIREARASVALDGETQVVDGESRVVGEPSSESPALDDVEVLVSKVRREMVAGRPAVPGNEGHAALSELARRLRRAEEERDHERERKDVWHERFETVAAERTAAETSLQAAEEALQEIIGYVPEGFTSPMDDEDSLNYRAIARRYFENHSTEESEG